MTPTRIACPVCDRPKVDLVAGRIAQHTDFYHLSCSASGETIDEARRMRHEIDAPTILSSGLSEDSNP